MRRGLLIAAGPGEWRAAWVEDGAIAELHVERGLSSPAGSVWFGRIVRLSPGLDAALVDISEDRPGFLPLRKDQRIDGGASVAVRVRREAQGGKGAQLRQADDSYASVSVNPPCRLEPPEGFAAALRLRLPGAPERVLTDDHGTVPELRNTFSKAQVSHAAPSDWGLDIEAAFEAALATTVALPNDGRLHIEETRTAVLVDIDTGSPHGSAAERTQLAANLAAAGVLARQIRLRQLGGGIVVDFAALEGAKRRERVRLAMTDALAADPARPEVLGWTRLGHLEIVRPRRNRPLSETLLEAASGRKTPATLAFEALRAVYREARANPAAKWRILANAEVTAALGGPAAVGYQTLAKRLGRAIPITTVAGGNTPPFDIRRL